MTDLRKAAEMALEALDGGAFGGYRDMVVETLRQALAQPVDAAIVAEVGIWGEEPPVKSYCGGKPNYCTPEVTGEVGACVTCGAPKSEWLVDDVNISQERVDETAKREHEPVGYIDGMYGGYMVFTPINPSAVYLNGTALYLAPPKREWVGLDGEIPGLGLVTEEFYNGMIFAEDYLREKNGG